MAVVSIFKVIMMTTKNNAPPSNPKKKIDVIGIIIKLAAVIFIVLGLLKLGAEMTAPPDPYQKEAGAFTSELQPIDARALPEMIRGDNATPAVLMLYASWCSSCRKFMPELLRLYDTGKMGDARLIVLSIDEYPEKLSHYIISSHYEGRFTPYIVRSDSVGFLKGSITSFGGKFRGAIPYVAVFDVGGQLMADTVGGDGWSNVISAMKQLGER